MGPFPSKQLLYAHKSNAHPSIDGADDRVHVAEEDVFSDVIEDGNHISNITSAREDFSAEQECSVPCGTLEDDYSSPDENICFWENFNRLNEQLYEYYSKFGDKCEPHTVRQTSLHLDPSDLSENERSALQFCF